MILTYAIPLMAFYTTTEAARELGYTREHVVNLVGRLLKDVRRFGKSFQLTEEDMQVLRRYKRIVRRGRPKSEIKRAEADGGQLHA